MSEDAVLTEPWLVIIDPQRIFADPESQWCAPNFTRILAPIKRVLPAFGDRVVLTRWLPGTTRPGAWKDYFQRWSFADRPATDPYFDLVPAAQEWLRGHLIAEPTFSKWGAQLQRIVGPTPQLYLAGVATDCCVLSTALAAADAGAWVRVIADACAGADTAAHERALTLMAAYSPQIEIVTSGRLHPVGIDPQTSV